MPAQDTTEVINMFNPAFVTHDAAVPIEVVAAYRMVEATVMEASGYAKAPLAGGH